MKRIITLSVIMIFLLSLAVPSAFAGSKQRHRWQGVAIGLGAAILGNAIINSDRYDSSSERVVVIDRDDHRHHRYSDHRSRGHWEVRKIWVEPRCERVWNPGHYNRYNQWVPGRYITLERAPGYWEHERVWVGCCR